MIVKITFDNDKVMLFGNSYKPWTMQFYEFMWEKDIKPVKFESCKDEWIWWGGLKWCSEDIFQKQLNREGCQDNEPDNSAPRQYVKMVFVEDKLVKNMAMKILKRE